MARLLAGWVLFEFLWLKREHAAQGLPVKPFLQGARGCGLNLLLNVAFFMIVFGSYLFTFDCEQNLSCRSNAIFFSEAKKYNAHSFGTLSIEFNKWSELTRETGARWDTRFNCVWMLPAFILNGPGYGAQHAWIKTAVGNDYAEDMQRYKPDIFFVDASPNFFGKQPEFDLIGYYSAIPAFRKEWTHYKLTGVIDACLPQHPKASLSPTALRLTAASRFIAG